MSYASQPSRNAVQYLLQVVEVSEKKRFSLSVDGQRIRAAQGHSVAVQLGLSPREPPSVL
jgi:putative RNA 2'-phosphotransferase